MCNTLHTSIVFWTIGTSLCIASVSLAFAAIKYAMNMWDIF